jgi:hypothetical protein
MNPFRKLPLVITLCLTARLVAAAPTDWIVQLSSPDMAVRRDAIDRIQTLDDPRIPEDCLPLLHDPGLSIRRQAARAIGSRYYQVPKERLPEFIAALRQYRREVSDDDKVVAERGLGLLTHDFSEPAFSVSPDKKWVLYEQRRRPMIADTGLETRQLLAPKVPAGLPYSRIPVHIERGEFVEDAPYALVQPIHLLKLMTTSESVDDLFHPHWNPASTALELQPDIQARFFTPGCLWRSRDGAYRVFMVESFQRLYGKRFPHWSTTLDFVKWEGPKAIFKIHDCDDDGGPPYDPIGILVSVNIDTWKIAAEKE